jgi:N-acetylglucosamine-6-sulfatase
LPAFSASPTLELSQDRVLLMHRETPRRTVCPRAVSSTFFAPGLAAIAPILLALAAGCGATAAREAAPAAPPSPASPASPASRADAAAARRPNVVFVLTDDLRWDTLSAAGHPHVKTPHIDRLAAEGVLFRNAFCTTSLCSPSRASILGGLYAHAHGVLNNFTDYPEELQTFPRVLQAHGYATAYVGKWHMGEQDDRKRPGFDHFVTHKGQGKYFDNEFNVDGERRAVPGYYTHVVTDMALEWVRAQPREKPFLLMIGHKAPHSFYLPEPRYEHAFDGVKVPYPDSAFQLDDNPSWYRDRLDTWHGIYGPLFEYRKEFPDRRPEAVEDFARMVRSYWGTVLSVDDSVGRLYEALRELGELEDTLFIFTGDNGLLNGEHGMVDKRTMHEPSIRVPLVVRYPGLTPPARPRIVHEMVLTVDLAPTILDLCGAPPLERAHGRSWRRLAEGDASGWRRSFYYACDFEKEFPYTPNVRGVRTEEWKYIRYPSGDGFTDSYPAELFHLTEDPGEVRNLAGDPRHAGIKAELHEELARLQAELGALPDRMPRYEGIGSALPDKAIR